MISPPYQDSCTKSIKRKHLAAQTKEGPSPSLLLQLFSTIDFGLFTVFAVGLFTALSDSPLVIVADDFLTILEVGDGVRELG